MILSFNHAAEKLFGFEKNQILGKNVKQLMDPAIARIHDQLVSNYFITGSKRLIGNVRYVCEVHKKSFYAQIGLSAETFYRGVF